VTSTPELEFWLRHVERRGAAVEPEAGTALVLLPEPVRQDFGLPEEVVVTGDPEAALEDGAVLLVAGHPVVDRAAAAVLDEGDVARHHVAWPDGRLPDPGWFVARARERIPVDHGRVDPDGPPEAVYLPVLRIGALLTLTLDDRFQEREEVCVDAHTGLLLADDLGRRLEALPSEARPPSRHTLPLDLRRALTRVHDVIESRATARGLQLAAQAHRAREDALAEAETYYEAALRSLEERAVSAAGDRRSVLEAQAVTTRAERARRLDEIGAMFTPRHTWRPYRLHLVLAPAARVTVRVRRGERSWPLPLTWLLTEEEFLPVACPSCGGLAPLVAGRERLACRGCGPRPGHVSPSSSGTPGPATAEPVVEVTPPVSRPSANRRAPVPTDPGGPEAAAGVVPARRSSAPPRAGAAPETDRAVEARTAARLRQDRRLLREGERLTTAFWQAVADRQAPRGRHVLTGSPLRVLLDLLGPLGPRLLAGISSSALLTGVSFRAVPFRVGGQLVTTGEVRCEGREHPFTIHWRSEGDRLVAVELLPFVEALGAELPSPRVLPSPTVGRLDHGAALRLPDSAGGLARALWDVELPVVGLPVVLRCLAAASRVGAVAGEHRPPVLAAALVSLVASRARLQRPVRATAMAHGVDRVLVERAVRQLRPLLHLGPDTWW
jgi:hypothetical protein